MTEPQVETPVETCNHAAHYRTSGYDRTCLECGHKWSVTPPALEIEVRVELQYETRVDMVAYFNGLAEHGREAYKNLDDQAEELGIHEDWERPIAFLWPAEVDGPASVLPYHGPGIVRDWADQDDGEVRLVARNGTRTYPMDWSPEDFEMLRTHVPWLDAWHKEREEVVKTEEDVIHSRIPGPLDTPLDFPEGTP